MQWLISFKDSPGKNEVYLGLFKWVWMELYHFKHCKPDSKKAS